jgi:diacylglycerol kinase family enzyme
VAAALERDWDVRLLGEGEDVAELAQAAAARGAEALGMAGGDGSLAPVAAAALEADVPFLPVPFGTRNHFARDAGFDVDDPLATLDAQEELRVDVGVVNGRVFLNNVSLGIYASLVHDPDRKTKNRLVALARLAQAAFARTRRPLHIRFEADGRTETHAALLLLVAAGDYGADELGGLGVRERLDEGRLHAYVIEAAARRTLVALLARAVVGRAAESPGAAEYAATRFTVGSKRSRIHAAVDGEPVLLGTPLEFEIRPRALRLLAPSRDGAEAASGR